MNTRDLLKEIRREQDHNLREVENMVHECDKRPSPLALPRHPLHATHSHNASAEQGRQSETRERNG